MPTLLILLKGEHQFNGIDVVAVAAFRAALIQTNRRLRSWLSLCSRALLDRLMSEGGRYQTQRCFTSRAHLSFLGLSVTAFICFISRLLGSRRALKIFPDMPFFTQQNSCCVTCLVSHHFYPFLLHHRMIEQPSIALGKVVWKI